MGILIGSIIFGIPLAILCIFLNYLIDRYFFLRIDHQSIEKETIRSAENRDDSLYY